MFRTCKHIMTTGLRCKSPAMRKDVYCYFHTGFRRQRREMAEESTRPPEFIAPKFNQLDEFVGMAPVKPEDIEYARGVMRKPMEVDLGLLEDAAAIQLAISNVLHALAIGRLEVRRAKLLLYGLQVAVSNLRKDPAAMKPAAEHALRTPAAHTARPARKSDRREAGAGFASGDGVRNPGSRVATTRKAATPKASPLR